MDTMQKLINFTQRAVKIKSYSDEEGALAREVLKEMQAIGYDEATIDSTGNVVGRIGYGSKIIHFDSHLDTVQVSDPDEWEVAPFSGEIRDGFLWGRGSVDMKSGLCASIYAGALAKEKGYLEGKTIYVTGTVCEEYCDGENLKHFYQEFALRPNYCIICEPSNNLITIGHKGKAQILITTHGISAHGSAPEKGINAVYEMAEIISRVESLNQKLFQKNQRYGTVVLSNISCISASLNAVPSECSIYLDRRLAPGETLEQVRREMDDIVAGKRASWKVGTLIHTTWAGKQLVYEPMHAPWVIGTQEPLTQALIAACTEIQQCVPNAFEFWDFGTNAITPVSMGIPTIGFGPGEYKLAHMRDERCAVAKIEEACRVYCQLIHNL